MLRLLFLRSLFSGFGTAREVTLQSTRSLTIVLLLGLVAPCAALAVHAAVTRLESAQEKDYITGVFDEPERAVAWIGDAEPGQRWARAFNYGEEAGRRLDVSEAERRARALTEPLLLQSYWDGYAHTAPWPDDEPANYIRAIRGLSGQALHVPLEDGVLMRFTERHAEDVPRVVAYAAQWSTLTRRSPTNGVRVGLQHALGDDMDAAIAKAAEYPEYWQHDLYEELGWRVGAHRDEDLAQVRRTYAAVPEGSRCWFAHGMVRGRALHVSIDDAIALNAEIPPICQAMGWHAIGWVLHQQYPEDRSVLEPYAAKLNEYQRNALQQGYTDMLETQPLPR